MSILSYLLLSVALLFVMILVQALFATAHYGLGALAGPRDDMKAPSAKVARAARANQNMIEGMVMFIPLALAAIQTGAVGSTVTLGAALFFWARLVYAPIYWFGVPWVRTLVWAVSIAGLVIMFISLLNFI
jgi:uncharacterized MAPEG superfamily protein